MHIKYLKNRENKEISGANMIKQNNFKSLLQLEEGGGSKPENPAWTVDDSQA